MQNSSELIDLPRSESIAASPPASIPRIASGRNIDVWEVENPVFWRTAGEKIAHRNLVFSIFAEFLAFSVWQMWSAVAVQLPRIGFPFDLNQLFWLTALPGLTGATLRLPYAFLVPVVGGRNWTLISTALLLLPAAGIGYAIQHPDTPYFVFLILALLCGFGGGNFASSMANINYFFPEKRKGLALGLNAAGGNIGVSVVQFIVPTIISFSIFGSMGGHPVTVSSSSGNSYIWLQNAALLWIPFILLALGTTWFFMNNLTVAKTSIRFQLRMFSERHTWLMSVLYMGTFGSFIGYSAGFPLLIQSQFPGVNAFQYSFIGPLIGSLSRPLGGWLADRAGGAKVTFWNFISMIFASAGALYFLASRENPNAFAGFFSAFLVLFFCAGIGNGSTYRMIPSIFLSKNRAGGNSSEEGVKIANRQAGAVVGITSAIAAYGAFFIPKSFGTSIALTGKPVAALFLFLTFYVLCAVLTLRFYLKKGETRL